jgi:phosphatidylglycerophosphate synthase
MTKTGYSYSRSLKSDASDELINTYLLRPVAGAIVRFLYRTPVTPNAVTIVATCSGGVAAICYAQSQHVSTVIAGLLLTLKDILDSADGQLARARQMYSRRGRFLDSIGDFVVNALVFAAIAYSFRSSPMNVWIVVACVLCFLGLTLRVSYHVFYHTSFLHLHDRYIANRISEEVTHSDFGADPMTLRLQRIFLVLYGWQDRFMARLDSWSRRHATLGTELKNRWYADRPGLLLSGFLGLGTELFLLSVCSVLNRLDVYFVVNVGLMNALWVGCILYRRLGLSTKIVL